MPIQLPAGVDVKVAEDNVVTVKGPKGTLTQRIPAVLSVEQEGAVLHVRRPDDLKENRALHGLARSLIHNMVTGVTEGFKKELDVNGVGYRVAKEGKKAFVRLPSGELRLALLECMATIGQIGNEDHENLTRGKAGKTRWLGRRPHVRGMVMNPVDHPMGGGEGRSKSHKHPVSPWGTPAKGYRTRKRKPSDKFIVRRRFEK